jgi:hypothetical protein
MQWDNERHSEYWIDEAAGPLVRPYTMTGGRTRPSSAGFDLVAYIMTVEQPPSDVDLHPEHLAALDACQRPLSVAELASELDLPLGVIRVLLGDLLERGLVMVREPAKDLKLPDQRLLEAVMDGLQAL